MSIAVWSRQYARSPYLILEVIRPVIGAHSSSAVGLAELPFDIPVAIEDEDEVEFVVR